MVLPDSRCSILDHERPQRRPMRGDELRQRIGPFSPRAHVIVVEILDLTDLRQAPFPILHPRMRRRCTRPGAKRIKRRLTRVSCAKPQSNTAVASISMRNSGSARAETPIQVLAGDFPEKRILSKQCPPLFRSRLDSPRRKSAEQQRLLTCRQPLPSLFQGYGMLALPAQERCLHRRCSSVRPKPSVQR